jgi:high-affinity iron transporter
MLLAIVFMTGGAAAAQRAEVAWQDAEALRVESAQIQRRLFRAQDQTLRADVEARLTRVEQLWAGRLSAAYGQAAPADAVAIQEAVTSLARAVSRWDPREAAVARSRIWTGLIGGAYRATLASFAAGDLARAQAWLNIREYARTARDTAASIAMAEALAGRLDSGEAARIVEAELLGVYASEMRRAIAEAKSHLSDGFDVQRSAAVARAAGLHRILAGNIAARLGAAPAAETAALVARVDGPTATGGAELETILEQLQVALATYAPTSLRPEEIERRSRLLARFLGLIPVEYGKGVRGGVVAIPFEYFEATLFRDRAEMLAGELAHDLAARAPQALERLTAILGELKAIIGSKGDEAAVEALAQEAVGLVTAAYGSAAGATGSAAALEMLPDLFDEILVAAGAGDWEEAEMKRLEAYSLFDPDIEQRLMPRAPALALRMESDFWEGSAAAPGLGRAITMRNEDNSLRAAVARLKAATAEAKSILDVRVSAVGAFVQSLAILLREGLEAVLVLSCMVGALKANGAAAGGQRGWAWPMAGGVAAALAGSLALWFAVGKLFAMTTIQRELLEGITALAAAAVLVYVTHWIFRKAYVGDWISGIRRRTQAAAGSAGGSGGGLIGWTTLFALAFLVVFREGFETVLFYEALLVDAPASGVLAGLLAGSVLTAAVAFAILGLEAKLPMAAFFRVTGALLALLCITLVGSGIRGLQTAALVPATPVAWFPDFPALQLYLGLYPVAETLAVQAVIAALLLLSLAWPVLRQRALAKPAQQ